jgi:catechol 2,3-dioxygenase-like lactoylglutathione lyase family enzyme
MEIVVTSVFVDDLDKALAFYTKKLGFVKKHDVPLGGDARWLTVVGPKAKDGVELLLEPGYLGSLARQVKAWQATLVENGIPATSFGCDDAEAEYKRLSKLGVKFSQKPMRAGPVTIAVFDDTCGNLIQIAQRHE